MNRKTVRQCLEENLSGLYVTERKHRMIMREITTGGKTVKRKVSWSLILACVLILALAGAAYAMISWRQMAETTAQLESQVGYFETWDAEQKAELLQQLVACGEMENSEEVQKALAEASAQQDDTRVTSLLENWMELPEDAITLMSIMETFWASLNPGRWKTRRGTAKSSSRQDALVAMKKSICSQPLRICSRKKRWPSLKMP